MKKYLGNKTIIQTSYNQGEKIYYEKAYDSCGNPLMIGDRVKVITYDDTDGQSNLVGQEREIIGIFQGDLMLRGGHNYDYCWPRKVLKINK